VRYAALLLALCSAALCAQDLRERALEQEKRELEQKRQQQEKERSVAEEQRRELSSPIETKKRDPKACENARIQYQTSCGSPTAPKYRNPGCRDAEIFLRDNCR
jgi:hypothetical protein